MTETIAPPTAKPIHHWIGGKSVPSHLGAQRPGLEPGNRRAVRRGRLRDGRGDRCRRPDREGGVHHLALRLALPPRRALLQDPPARRRAPCGHRAVPDARARQGHLRRARRGRPRPRGDRVRVRDPDPAQGRVLRAGLDRDRRLLDPPAARRRRRDHAVQLPGDGAHVDVGAGDRLREHVRAQALREGSLGVGLHGGAAQGGRPPGRRLQRRPRRQGRGRCDPRAPGHRRGLVRRLDADRALRLRDRHEEAASACRRSAGRRTT